jgi:hypothetical protein
VKVNFSHGLGLGESFGVFFEDLFDFIGKVERTCILIIDGPVPL